MFAELLELIVNKVEGTLGAVVMGMDGISIEKRISDQTTNIEALAAEYTSLLRASSSTTQDLGQGSLEEFIVFTNSRVVAIRMLTQEYFLLILLEREGNVGRARYELKKARYRLAKEFAI